MAKLTGKITYNELIKEIEADLAWMKSRFEDRVSRGTMDRAFADRRIERKKTILRMIKICKEQNVKFNKGQITVYGKRNASKADVSH